MDDLIFQYGRYVIEIVEDHVDEHGKERPAYGVINTETDVCEFSTTLLFEAMKWARLCEIHVKQFEDAGEGASKEESWPQLKDIN